MSELRVPIAVDGLWLQTPQRVVGPRQDFERLPWFDGKRDHNTNTPPLASAIEAEPFADHATWLEPGVHLHWALPDGLTRGATEFRPDCPIHIDNLWMPAAPNRWLVFREDSNQNIDRVWLVESDYVHPGNARPDARAVAYPRTVRSDTQPPYLFLGRQVELDKTSLQAIDPDHTDADATHQLTSHAPGLTALGYGDPLFAAHYPTCRSVFGLYDDAPQAGGNTYQIIGWYGALQDDPLANYVSALADDIPRAKHILSLNDGPTPATLDAQDLHVATLKGIGMRFGWQIENAEHDGLPDTVVCAGKTFVEDASTATVGENTPDTAMQQTLHLKEIAVGENALDAFTNYLLRGIPADVAPPAQVMQALADTDVSHHALDLPAKLEEMRHNERFVAHRGHNVWAIRPAQHQGNPEQAGVKLPPDIAEHLNLLNAAQAEYDRAIDREDALRQRVFDHWSHYMNAMMPEHDQAPFGANINSLRKLLERRALQPLEAQLASKGQLIIATDDSGEAMVIDASTHYQQQPVRGAYAGYTTNRPIADILLKGNTLGGFLLGHGSVIDDIVPLDNAGMPVRPKRTGNVAQIRFHPDEELTAIKGIHGAWGGQELILRIELYTNIGRKFGPYGWTSNPGTAFTLTIPQGMQFAGLSSHLSSSNYVASIGLLLRPKIAHLAVSSKDSTLASAVVSAHQTMRTTLAEHNLEGDRLALSSAPGPRFYSPHDPVLMFNDDQLAPTSRHGQDRHHDDTRVMRRCELFDMAAGWRNASSRFSGNSRVPLGYADVLAQQASGLIDTPMSRAGDWHPIELEWQAEVESLSEGSNQHNGAYRDDFIAHSQHLPDDHMDLRPALGEEALHRSYDYISGRSVLNPSAGNRLTRRMVRLIDDSEDSWANRLVTNTPENPLLVQLGGLHDQLLMRGHLPQLDIMDLTALPEGLRLAKQVKDALAGWHPTSPQPDAAFHPIRSGELVIQQLRLIDSFGRSRRGQPGALLTQPRMRPLSGGADRVRLPMRLSQPARLNFRWLSAAHDNAEAGLHPAATPVHAWLLADEFEGAVVFYTGNGRLLGHVSNEAQWVPAPGDDNAPRSYRDIDDLTLARMIRWLTDKRDPTLVAHFLQTLDAALAQIDPLDAAQHQSRALLISRPVALVRARISLQLQHGLADDQSQAALRSQLEGVSSVTHGVEHINVPVRLGEHGHHCDGLCAFWKQPGPGDQLGELYTAPGLTVDGSHSSIKIPTGTDLPSMPLQLTPDGSPVDITMLMDPRGAVHATTGLLPVKSVSMPAEFYQDQLQNLRVDFSVGPLLMAADKVEIPLPLEPGFSWSWLEKETQGWHSVPHHPRVTRTAIMEAFGANGASVWKRLLGSEQIVPEATNEQIDDKLIIDPDNIVEGLMMPADPNADPTRFDDLSLSVAEVNRTLHALAQSIEDTQESARYDSITVARDGWIQLRPTPHPEHRYRLVPPETF